MIRLYCKKNHKDERKANNVDKKGLCPECQELLDYVEFRRSKCPWGDNKPFCANCTIHCYKPEMREKIRKVMRYSGPRMIFSHPILAMSHVIETLRERKKIEKAEALKAERKAAAAEKAKQIMAEREAQKKAEETANNVASQDTNNEAVDTANKTDIE